MSEEQAQPTLGFWKIAQESPDRLAVVDPDGAETTYGEVLAMANQIVHGLRSLGLEKGDGVTVVLANGLPMIAAFMAAAQAGWYITPINHHLVGPEIAFIVNDCEAKVFIGDERFAEACANAAKELSIPASNLLSVGTVPGFRPIGEVIDSQPTSMPENRTMGQAMHYTS